MTREQFIAEAKAAEAMLYHVSKSILKNDADCADAVQEALLKAYEKLHTLKKDEFFRTWITKILMHECYKICRKNKKIVPYEEYMINAKMWEEGRYTGLYMAIMELPQELRLLVTLYYLEGFSQKEISEIMNMREGTIKSRLSRARRLLKEQLADEEEILC